MKRPGTKEYIQTFGGLSLVITGLFLLFRSFAKFL